MKLVETLRTMRDRAMAKAEANTKSVTVQKFEQCINSVADYLGDGVDVDLLEVISTGWIEKFREYLLNGDTNRYHARPLSETTANSRIDRIRTCCREAIRQGSLPNVAIFANDQQRNLPEFERLDLPARNHDLKLLTSLFYSKLDLLKTKDSPQLASDAAAIGYALLSVLLGGIGFEGLARLKASDLEGNRLALPHLGQTVTLNHEVISLIEALRIANPQPTEALIGHDISGEACKAQAINVLSRIALDRVDAFQEPFTQWIEVAGEAGLPIQQRRELIDILYKKSTLTSDQQQQVIQQACDFAAIGAGCYSRKWHCIKCAGKMPVKTSPDKRASLRRVNGTMLQSNFVTTAPHSLAGVEYYAPYDPVVKERDGRTELKNNRLLDELLFFKASRRQADAINRMLMSTKRGFIFGRRNGTLMEYAEITEADMQRLRTFLNVRDDKRFVVDDPEQLKNLQGTCVRIIAGIYKGYEGEICQLTHDKNGKSPRPCFVIRIKGICALATASIPPDHLQKI